MKIGIIGTGAYSAALAYHLQKKEENEIVLWTENYRLVKKFEKKRRFNFLPTEQEFNENVNVSSSLETAMKDSNLLIILVGSKYFEKTIKNMKAYYQKSVPILVGTKGMDLKNKMFFSDMTRKTLKCNSYSFFAGPTFAKELPKDNTFSLTVAGSNKLGFNKFKAVWKENINLNYTNDLYGLEILSVLKNIYAIGSGILKGLNVSNNIYYTYVTDIINETKKIIKKCNGLESTIFEYGGIGDLLLTCNSETSRNFTLGNMIGKKLEKKEIDLYKKDNTIEGLTSLENIMPFLTKYKLHDTYLEKIFKIVMLEKDPNEELGF